MWIVGFVLSEYNYTTSSGYGIRGCVIYYKASPKKTVRNRYSWRNYRETQSFLGPLGSSSHIIHIYERPTQYTEGLCV